MKFIIMIFPLPELIMAGGSLIGGALNRGGSRGAINRQNEYNSPKEQVKRLLEAGLPYAAMTGGMAGNQSQTQSETGSGLKEGIDTYIQTTMQRKQIELLNAQINNTNTDTKVKEVEGNTKAFDLQLRQMDPTAGEPVAAGARQALAEHNIRLANQDLAQNSAAISKIEKEVKQELKNDGTLSATTRQQLVNLVLSSDTMRAQIRAMGQTFDVIEMQRKVEKTLIDALEQNGMSTGEAYMHALMQGTLGAGKLLNK